VPLPAERAGELEATLKLMTEVGYIRMEEVPGIPQLPRTPAAIAYAPLGEATLAPDVVLVWGSAASIMLLNEAAMRAGVSAQLQAMSRPTCMALPAALLSGTVASVGCIGNRVYTGATEGELYAAVRGADIAKVAAEAGTIASANAALTEFHTNRKSQITNHKSQIADSVYSIGSPGVGEPASHALPSAYSFSTDGPRSPGRPSLTVKPMLVCR
jgi:hypothetical protein